MLQTTPQKLSWTLAVGFGGSCLQKDILNLVYMCDCEGLYEVTKYWQMVVDLNEHQKSTFAGKSISTLWHIVAQRKDCRCGFTFMKDAGDVPRDACHCHQNDPKVKTEDALSDLKYHDLLAE